MIIFFMTPIGEFLLLVFVFTILTLLLRPIFWLIEKFILRRQIITKNNKTKVYYIIITLIVLTSLTITYVDYNPGDQLYVDEWNKYTKIKLPEDFKIQDKYYGSPDIGGDFTTTVLLQLKATDYMTIKQKVVSDTSYKQKEWYGSNDLYKIMTTNNLTDTDLTIKLSKNVNGDFQIGFIDHNNSILFTTFSY
jgi:hypothetical protein